MLMAGLMNPTGKNPSSIIDELRNRLAMNVSRDPETLLASMPEDKRNAILVMAREANRVMRFSNISAAQAITRLYPNADMDKRKVVLALLNAEEDPHDSTASDAAHERAWAEWDKLRPIEEVLARRKAPTAPQSQSDNVPEQLSFLDQLTPPEQPHSPATGQSDFMSSLMRSESGGRADAEYVTRDGRRHVGLLQFSDARLQDYRNATGEAFTQDEFVQDMELQQRVGDWHVADIDKAIDDLGSEAVGYDRDGLRAVAHLGGITGMTRFVRSQGQYNPSDELQTSLGDYYARFRSGAS
jgi:hypothetical protein